jgi:signal peptidase I
MIKILKFKNFLNEASKIYENISDFKRNDDGTITYRNEKFPGFNKPKRYKGKGKYKKRVLAKEGDKIKIVNYGHKDYEDFTIHKDTKRRKNFRSRHNCDPVNKLSKLTARYWACQDLW